MAFEGLSDKLNTVFKKLKSHGKLTESDVKEAMREVRMALLEADVSYKVVKDFVANVSQRAVGEEVLSSLTPAQQVIKIVHEELCKLMGEENARIQFPSKPPCVMMMCGLQGSGKTTHAAKLAKYLKKQGHYPLLVACDVYRPAAINQLQVVGERAGVKVFEMGQIAPQIIAKEALKFAKDHGNDVVILDTAGRLHIDEAMMVGGAAVKAADEGDTGKMVVIDRVSDDPYMAATGIYDVHRIANEEKLVPRNWMNKDANNVTKDFIDYIKPLIQGDYQPIMVNGVPRHLVLNTGRKKKN